MHCDCHTFSQNYKYVSQTFLDRLLMQGGGSSSILSNLSQLTAQYPQCSDTVSSYAVHNYLIPLFILYINLNLGYSSSCAFNELSLPMSHFERQSVSLYYIYRLLIIL